LRRERSELAGVPKVCCDISDAVSLAEVIKTASPDVVVHLAARPGVAGAEVAPEAYDQVNVKGVHNIILACRAASVGRIVHSSSSSVYGTIVGVAAETVEAKPLGHYGRTKLMGERLLEEASAGGSLDVLILRPFSVIGPLGRPDMAPCRYAESLLSSQPIQLHDGAGRDFTSVHDVAFAFALAAEVGTKGCHVMNVGSGQPHSAFDLAQGLAESLACRLYVNRMPLPSYMPMSTHADIRKAQSLLGWRPKRDFSESVAEFGKWFLGVRREMPNFVSQDYGNGPRM
jgi:UDP-glucuronate 4-epimerase